MPTAARERTLTIDQIDGTVTDRESFFGSTPGLDSVDHVRSARAGIALASIRTVLTVGLAAAAILVLLPALLAAQAAVGI
jgi:hypothetical protein